MHIAEPAVDIGGSSALWLAAGGASLQLVRRLLRVAAKRLHAFSQLTWERLGEARSWWTRQSYETMLMLPIDVPPMLLPKEV